MSWEGSKNEGDGGNSEAESNGRYSVILGWRDTEKPCRNVVGGKARFGNRDTDKCRRKWRKRHVVSDQSFLLSSIFLSSFSFYVPAHDGWGHDY